MPHCPHLTAGCCERCQPAASRPTLGWLPPAPACQHCWCQPGPMINAIAHQCCCKCGDRMAHIVATAMSRLGYQDVVDQLVPALNEAIRRGAITF